MTLVFGFRLPARRFRPLDGPSVEVCKVSVDPLPLGDDALPAIFDRSAFVKQWVEETTQFKRRKTIPESRVSGLWCLERLPSRQQRLAGQLIVRLGLLPQPGRDRAPPRCRTG